MENGDWGGMQIEDLSTMSQQFLSLIVARAAG